MKYNMDRKAMQLILATALIIGTMTVVGSYVVIAGFQDPLVIDIVKQSTTLLVMGVGAALAIFGLGRTVTNDTVKAI